MAQSILVTCVLFVILLFTKPLEGNYIHKSDRLAKFTSWPLTDILMCSFLCQTRSTPSRHRARHLGGAADQAAGQGAGQ